jgi:hypothetical protein
VTVSVVVMVMVAVMTLMPAVAGLGGGVHSHAKPEGSDGNQRQ